MLDISDLTQPDKVDQLTADHLIAGPMVTQILAVEKGFANGKKVLNVTIANFSLPWRPCKTMVRLMEELWGSDAHKWIGRAVRLFRDPTVRFGDDTPGGVRINGLSHIPGNCTTRVKLTKGKGVPCKVERLPEPPPLADPNAPDPLADAAAALSLDLAAVEAVIVATVTRGRPITDRPKAAAWARSEAGEAAIRAHLTPTAS